MNTDHKARRWWYWFAGPLALLWVILRSGANPKRLTYPCQQAAMPLAATWAWATIAFLGGSVILRRFAKFGVVAIGLTAAIWTVITSPEPSRSSTNILTGLPTWEVADPVSTVFVIESVPPAAGSLAAGDASVPDEYLPDPAIDTLVAMLSTQGVYLHQTATHPDGLVGADNVVIIKGNFQWTHQNTTNTDRIKGLVWQILNHPDGFSGEVVICDNTQNVGTGINANDDNADYANQSIVDVANTFQAKGYPVAVRDWTPLYGAVTAEYTDGFYGDGYIFEVSSLISYPKFRSPSGQYVSLRYGVWDSLAAAYDHDRLCIVDFPVLKQHVMAGATIAVKNWVGMMTTAYSSDRYTNWTAMHYTYFWGPYALVARTMEATFPRLSIVDATWISTNNATDLTNLVHARALAASTDPVAVSYYAAKHMLTPVAITPSITNPDLAGNRYRDALQNWTTYLADSAGLPCTRNPNEMSVYGYTFPGTFTPTGSWVELNLTDSVSVTFTEVAEMGVTYVETSSTGPAPPAGYQVVPAAAPRYLDIHTDATYTGPVLVNLSYNPAELSEPENQLRMFHLIDDGYGGQIWQNCTVTQDPVAHVMWGQVDGLSQFILAEPGCVCACHGDPQCDGVNDVLDVVMAVNIAFREWPPVTDPICPRQQTDVSCDGVTNVIDVVKFVNVAFRGGDPGTEFCDPCAP